MTIADIKREAEDDAALAAEIRRTELHQFVYDQPNFMKIPCPPLTYLVEGFIVEGQIGFIIGTSAGGKTTITTQIAAAVANGTECLSRKTVKRQVVVLDNENTIGGTQRRWARLFKGMDLDSTDVFWWGNWSQHRPDVPKRLDDPFLLGVIEAMDTHPLIIVDSFVTFLGDGDENSARDCAAVINQARALTSLGATVLFIHHFGKTKPTDMNNLHSSRGSSAIAGAADYIYNLDSTVKENKITKGSLYCAKARDSEKQSNRIELNVTEGSGLFTQGADKPTAKAGPTALKKKAGWITALELIVQRHGTEGVTKGQLETEAMSDHSVSRDDTRRWMNRCIEEGKIAVTQKGKAHRLIWVLNELP